MSYTAILGIWPGEKYETIFRLHNSWGSAPPVWEALAREFLDLKKSYEYPNKGYMERIDDVFALHKDLTIPISLRAVLMMTAERVYVSRKDYARAEGDIFNFMAHYPDLSCCVEDGVVLQGKRAYHWPSIALYYGQNPKYPAIALHCTSVSPNPFANSWKETEDGKDEVEVPFDWSTAYDLYAELDSLTK
jgi:hypothetical protein